MSRPVAKAQSYMDISNMLVSLEQKKKKDKKKQKMAHTRYSNYTVEMKWKMQRKN